jgi:hypothetical protein
MMQAYDGFRGAQTVAHVLSTIPDDLIRGTTGRQAGQIMSIRNAAYHEGAASQKIDTWAYDAPDDFLVGIRGTKINIMVNRDTITFTDDATGKKRIYREVIA